jgi:hypothetical protein
VIYVDKPFTAVSLNPAAKVVGERHGHRWCHLWADNLAELVAFAESIGLKQVWIHHSRVCDHFDLVPPMRQKAIDAGAKEMSLVEWYRKKQGKNTNDTY